MKNKQAFSLIEIMVVIGIIMLMTAISVPAFKNFFPKADRNAFIADLNALTNLAWRNALVTNRVHMILFDFQKRTISARMVTAQKDEKGEHGAPVSQAIKGSFVKNTIIIPQRFNFTQFSIENIDELATVKRTHVWFFINPNGIAQNVRVAFIDTKEKQVGKRSRLVRLQLNPFSAQFTVQS